MLLQRLRRLRLKTRDRPFVAAALLASYAVWLYAGDSPWTRAFDAAPALPELRFGLIEGEPASTLEALGAARADYLWMQAYDFVFVALLVMTARSAVALATKKHPAASAKIFLVPLAFAAAELAENSLLALFAAGALPPSGIFAFLQQTATSIKLGLCAFTVFLAFSFIAAVGGKHATGTTSA